MYAFHSVPVTLLQSLRRYVYIALLGMLALVIAAQVFIHYRGFAAVADSMRKEYMEQQKQEVRREVERIVHHIDYQRSRLQEAAMDEARERVIRAVQMVGEMQRRQRMQQPSQVERNMLDALAALRFDDGLGYFFVLSHQGRVLMHPDRPELEGSVMLEQKDGQGRPFVRELVGAALKDGSGGYSYRYTKPGVEGDNHTKVAYVQRLDEPAWIIGTGLYLSDFEERKKRELLAEIQQIRFGASGYLFVDDWQGVVLAHGAQPDLVGKNIWEHQDANGVKVVQKLIAAARTRDGDYVHYSWKKPETGEERSKVSFAQGIHDWQWMIGTGVYVDDVEQSIAVLQQTVDRQLLQNVLGTLLGALLVGLLQYLWVSRIYGRLRLDLLQFREFHEQADYLNEMVEARQRAEHKLRDHQDHLEQVVAERTLALQQQSQELRRMATTDLLTGLHNRRSFEQMMPRILGEVKRYAANACLVMLDIDHFKAINDRFGHEVGDQVLQAVVAHIGGQLRATDVFARWGGEEFVLLLAHTSVSAGLDLCQRLCLSLQEHEVEGVGRVTASFGLTDIRIEDNLDSLIRRADQAMYAAKHAGRDRVEVL
jgi:diguanylate cyclase (GGDEF)-like protein